MAAIVESHSSEKNCNSQDTTTRDNVEPEFRATRNYTSPNEQYWWWQLARDSRNWRSCYNTYIYPYYELKEDFRTRRSYYPKRKALRLRCGNTNDVGAFIRLTNRYCLLCTDGRDAGFAHTIQGDLPEDIPLIDTSLAACRIVGRMCVGNTKGLLVPETVYNTEFEQIKNQLPDSVEVTKIEDRLSALGNVIACNDRVAIIHPDLDKESEEIISDTLQVEVFRHMINNNPLVGSYCVLSSQGGLVCSGISNTELENLSSVLEIPLVTGTVNSGSKVIAAGLAVNDGIAYAGIKTTSTEFSVIESVFKL